MSTGNHVKTSSGAAIAVSGWGEDDLAAANNSRQLY